MGKKKKTIFTVADIKPTIVRARTKTKEIEKDTQLPDLQEVEIKGDVTLKTKIASSRIKNSRKSDMQVIRGVLTPGNDVKYERILNRKAKVPKKLKEVQQIGATY